MNKILRYALGAAAAAVLIAGSVIVTGRGRDREPARACETSVIHYGDSLRFIGEDEIRNLVEKVDGIPIGRRLEEIGLEKIELALQNKSVIRKADAWVTDDGILHIKVNQRTPVMKLLDGDKEFFVDETGFEFPMHESFHQDLPEIRCKAGRSEEENLVLLEFIGALRKTKYWAQGVKDIAIDKDGSISFRIGERKEKVVFGQPGSRDGRMNKLDIYYSTIVPSLEEGKNYKTVDLKYDGQIVCR